MKMYIDRRRLAIEERRADIEQEERFYALQERKELIKVLAALAHKLQKAFSG